MGMSRRSKRGIAALNHLQSRPGNQKYHTTRMEVRVGPPAMEPSIYAAAITAQELINAKLSVIPHVENNSESPNTEGRTEQSVHTQPEAGETATEDTSGGPQ